MGLSYFCTFCKERHGQPFVLDCLFKNVCMGTALDNRENVSLWRIVYLFCNKITIISLSRTKFEKVCLQPLIRDCNFLSHVIQTHCSHSIYLDPPASPLWDLEGRGRECDHEAHVA